MWAKDSQPRRYVIFDYNIAIYKHSQNSHATKEDTIIKRHFSNNLSVGYQPLSLAHVHVHNGECEILFVNSVTVTARLFNLYK